MKFLFFFLILSSHVWAQTTEVTLKPGNTSKTEVSPFSWEKIKAKFRINYFSETLGPSIKKWNDNEVEDDGTIKRDPTTMYHSFNVRYHLAGNLSVFASPRFNTVIGDRNDIYPDADPHVLVMDDWQFGLYYTFYSRPHINYSQTLTHRAPFGTKSRNEHIDSQVEWQHFVTWAISPAWRLLSWNNYRYYAYNEESTIERYRINWRNILNYTINDKWNLQVSYEFDIQHKNTNDKSSPKHRAFNYMKRYHSYTSLGVGYSPVRDFTIIPFIRCVDERNIRNETTVVGLWLLGRVI